MTFAKLFSYLPRSVQNLPESPGISVRIELIFGGCDQGLVKMRGLIFTIACLFLVFGTSAANAAKVYKWVDAQGNVTYSRKPPPDASAQEIRTRPTHISDEDAQSRLKTLTEETTNRQKNRDFLRTSDAEKAKANDRKTKNCETARQNLALLENSDRVQAKADDGQSFYLDDEARKRKLVESRSQIAEFCGP